MRLKEVLYLQHNPKVSQTDLQAIGLSQITWFTQKTLEILLNAICHLGAVSEDRKGAKLPEDDSEAAEASRKDREARSIAIEKVICTHIWYTI